MLGAILGGCYDLRGAARADAGADVAVTVDHTDDAASVDAMDANSVMDAVDALDADESSPPLDGSDVVEDLVTDLGPPPCPSGQTRCGESCVDTGTSVAHCGMCGMACPAREGAAATCVVGMCRFVCNAGVADCDGDASNGCEADLGRPENCGRCGTRCMEPSPLCQEAGGQYACVSGCSGMASTRCAMSCVDAQTDVQHCGACDRACAVPTNGRATCSAGSCGIACNTGFHACGAACADDTSVETCGASCTPCPARASATATCAMGACGFTCNAGFADCDGDASNGCEVDTRTTAAHCGMCARACATPANATPTCAMGTCGFTCNAGFADCDGNPGNGCEADLGSPGSCGRCGTRCMEPSPLCQEAGGQYACVSGCSGMASTRCAMSCVDAQTDVQHCGACDRACTVPMNGRATCSAGSCGFACNTGFHACGTTCADDTSVATCGPRCEPCPARANATAACAMGACGFTCNAGFADCDGDASNGCEVSTTGSNLSCSTCASGSGCAAVRGCGVNRCSPALAWTRYNGSTGPACAAVSAAGTVVSGGTFRGPTNFGGGAVTPRGSDVFVVAHNRDGSARWHRTYGGVSNDEISRIALDADGNVYACGSFSGTIDFGDGVTLTALGGSQDSFVLSLSPSGTLRWVRALGGTGREVASGISVGAAGRVVVSGVTESGTFSPPASVGPTGTAGGMDGFVAAFDQGGTHQWTRLFGGSGIDGAYGVGVGPSGEVAVAAQVTSNVTLGGSVTSGDTDAALIVYDPGGTVRWVQRFAIPDVNYGRNAAIDASGNIAFLMESEAASMGVLGARLDAPGHVVASFTSSGERRWARSIVGAGVGTSGFALSFDPGGGVLWSHYARDAALVIGADTLALGSGQAVVAFDSAGALRWARRIDGDSPWCVASGSGVVAIAGLSGVTVFDDNASCTMGACSLTCGAGLANCDGEASNGCEADLTSPASCGSCGRQCDATQVCAYGECVSPTRTGSPLPDARTSSACAWTGSEFIVWGGANASGQATGTGFRYDPRTNAWRSISAAGAPSPRIHVDNGFAWTGRELFVWGGSDVSGSMPYATGALYDPARDMWSPIASASAPSARSLYSGGWTGSEVVVWGGFSGGTRLGDGARFDPRLNRWTAMTLTGTPTARHFHQAVWTGTEFIVWGGSGESPSEPVIGGRYDPGLDRWRPMTATGAPRGRHLHSLVWTGSEVLVWGGATSNNATTFGDGARYDPSEDRWTAISSQNAPSPRQQHATVWTGREMIVWGGWGANLASVVGDAAAYDPANDRWRPVRGTEVPGAGGSCFQWTGTEMLVAGGRTGQPVTASMVRVTPPPRYLSRATPRATDRGLVAHYEFEGDLRDSGGVFGAATSLGTPAFVAGRYGRALACNGSSVAARLPDAPNWRRLTVSAHVRITAPVRSSFVVNGWDVSREHFHIGVGPRSGVDVYWAGNHPMVGTTVYEEIGVFSTRTVTTGAWVHMALAVDETSVVLYVDGEEVARRSQGGIANNLGRDILTGVELCGSSRNNNSYFLGAIDDLRIYDRALSVDEIRTLR